MLLFYYLLIFFFLFYEGISTHEKFDFQLEEYDPSNQEEIIDNNADPLHTKNINNEIKEERQDRERGNLEKEKETEKEKEGTIVVKEEPVEEIDNGDTEKILLKLSKSVPEIPPQVCYFFYINFFNFNLIFVSHFFILIFLYILKFNFAL